MSKAPSLNSDDTDAPEPDDPEELVAEHRELIEQIAAADVTLSDRAQRVLDYVDGDEDGDRDD
jgi:fructose-1,6-bisphosphatase